MGSDRGTAANGTAGAATLASLCTDQAANFTRLPAERIEEVVRPTGQGKPHQSRELLAPVYGWFTEGFDTRI